jgi:hypothetical protein
MVMQDAPIVPVLNPVYWDVRSTALHGYVYHNVIEYLFQDYSKS